MCAKNYENPTMLSRVTAINVGDVFFWDTLYIKDIISAIHIKPTMLDLSLDHWVQLLVFLAVQSFLIVYPLLYQPYFNYNIIIKRLIITIMVVVIWSHYLLYLLTFLVNCNVCSDGTLDKAIISTLHFLQQFQSRFSGLIHLVTPARPASRMSNTITN